MTAAETDSDGDDKRESGDDGADVSLERVPTLLIVVIIVEGVTAVSVVAVVSLAVADSLRKENEVGNHLCEKAMGILDNAEDEKDVFMVGEKEE